MIKFPFSSALTIVQIDVDPFGSQPALSSSAASTVDLFAASDTDLQPETKSTNITPTTHNIVDPFAAVPLNNFDSSDPFGAFTSNSVSVPSEPPQKSVNGSSQSQLSGNLSLDSKSSAKKDTFQVKSGIWADSLSRGLIDLNISARKYYLSQLTFSLSLARFGHVTSDLFTLFLRTCNMCKVVAS